MKSFKETFTIKAIARVLSLTIVALVFVVQSAFALTANTAYTLELAKVNSNGTTTVVSSTSVTSDANGKITFTFSNVPTQATNSFLIVTVTDAAGAVQIKSFAPAPAANGTNTLGVNTTTTAQANLMEQLGAVIGTDDPIVVSFGLMFTRDPNLSTTDIANLAIIAQQAIVNGMEVYMLANGATAAQMATFKSKLVYNATAGTTDLRDFTALTKSAVDTPAQAKDDMAKASGLISAAFVDAAAAASIDLDLVLSAFDSAGIKLQSGAGLTAMNALSIAFRTTMNQAVNSFFTQLSAVKVKERYSNALTVLGASAGQLTQFNAAVSTMATDMAAIDTTYALYYDGTPGYDMTETLAAASAAGHLSLADPVIAAGITAGPPNGLVAATSTVQNAMDYAYQYVFAKFQGAAPGTGIQSTNADITTMKSNVATALAVAVGSLPAGLGTYRDFTGSTINWPIPQTASVNFIAAAISATGSLSYTRTTLAVPANMAWLNGNTGVRTDFGPLGLNLPASFADLMGMQEDIMIAEFTRFYIFDPANGTTGGNPTQAQMQSTKAGFITNIAAIVGNISGTTDGTTAFTTAQKKALVLSQQQPSLH